MNSHKSIWLLASAAVTLALTALLVVYSPLGSAPAAAQTTNGTNSSGNTTTASTGNASGMLDCSSIASQLGGQVIQNPSGACDVTVPLEGLEVKDNSTGTSISKLLVINPLFEFLPVSDGTPNMTGTSDNQTGAAGGTNNTGNATTASAEQNLVYGFAEFGAREDQLPLLMRLLSNTSWNVVAVHNHVAMESPRMLFVHATGAAEINTLAGQAQGVLEEMSASLQASETGTASQGTAQASQEASGAATAPTSEKQ